MDWHQGTSDDRHIQFVPAEKGWLALFEEHTDEGIKIHADPVIAWCLGAEERDEGHHVVAFGQAVVGASPWLEKADTEQETHFFTLVREEQLDEDFLEELKCRAHHSREDIMRRASQNQHTRLQGHASWRRQRRVERNGKPALSPMSVFSLG